MANAVKYGTVLCDGYRIDNRNILIYFSQEKVASIIKYPPVYNKTNNFE